MRLTLKEIGEKYDALCKAIEGKADKVDAQELRDAVERNATKADMLGQQAIQIAKDARADARVLTSAVGDKADKQDVRDLRAMVVGTLGVGLLTLLLFIATVVMAVDARQDVTAPVVAVCQTLFKGGL